MENKTFIYEVSGGCGHTNSKLKFLSPILEFPNCIPNGIISDKKSNSWEIELTYKSHWMGSDEEQFTLRGIYILDPKAPDIHGFIFIDDEEVHLWLECLFTQPLETFNTMGISSLMVMANSAHSSDNNKTDQMLLLFSGDTSNYSSEKKHKNFIEGFANVIRYVRVKET